MKRFMTKKVAVVGLAVALVIGVGGAAFAYFTSVGAGTGSAAVGTSSKLVINQIGTTVYNSTVSPLPGSMASQAFEATQTSEFGNEINLVTSSSPLANVIVTMESWTCGNYVAIDAATAAGTTVPACVTTPGTSYPLPITFTIYKDAGNGVVGSAIATDTQTFNIPFRPSADLTNCSGTAKWNDNAATAALYGVTADNACHSGLANNITFNFSSQRVVLPSTVIYGISFDTDGFGPSPIGSALGNSPSDSLNVAVTKSDVNPTVGTDTYVGQLDMSTVTAGWYCDDGAGGVGGFRLDSPAAATAPCASPSRGGWSVNTDNYGAPYYLPAVQFNTGGTGDLYPGTSQPINFSVTNPGGGNEQVQNVTISVASSGGDVETIAGDTNSVVSGCVASWFTINGSASATLTLNQNIPGGGTIDWVGAANISLTNEPFEQDACQGITVGLNFSSN